MKMSYILFSLAGVLLLSGSAMAGNQNPGVPIPTFTPWGTVLAAVALGISGAYILLKKRK